MRLVRLMALAACVWVGAGTASAEIAAVSQTLDYTDNGSHGGFFWPTDTIVDHTPYQRHAWEDWGWTHDVSAAVPTNVTDIDAATLSILAWGVDDTDGEVDIVYVNGVEIGTLEGPSNGQPVPPVPPEAYETPGQPNTLSTQWSVTSFTLPHNALQELLDSGRLDVFLNIDAPLNGDRVTIRSSTLTVDYLTGGSPVPEPATLALLGLGALVMLRRRRS
jgi:hypothetical protein